MVSVDSGRILADATKTARHFYALSSFLMAKPVFSHYRHILSEYRDIAQDWTNNRRIIAGIRPYNKLHRRLVDREGNENQFSRIQKPYILFVTGISPDVSEEGYLAYDFFSMRNEFSNRILLALDDEDPELFENTAIIPVAPVLQPVHFRQNGSLEMYHVFEDIVANLSWALKTFGKVPFGSVTKSVDDINKGILKPGFAQHHIALYDSAAAKEIVDPQRRKKLEETLGPLDEEAFVRVIERSCLLNRHLMAMTYGYVIDSLEFPRNREGIKQIDIAASKKSPYFRIIEMAVEHYAENAELTRWSKTFLRDIEMPVQREAHPTAIKRIINRIKSKAVPKNEKADISDLL